MQITADTASEHVRVAEQRLRELIARLLAHVHGPQWETNEISNKIRVTLERIRADELAARPQAPPEPHLLGYAGYKQLITIAKHHWPCCVQSTGLWSDLRVIEYELARLHAVRNPAAHGRTVFAHEYIEGEGTARRLCSSIEEYWRREASMKDEIWLYIEQAEDSLGNRQVTNQDTGDVILNGRQIPIRVGDLLHLRVTAFDPLGRALQYRLMDYFGSSRLSTPWQGSPEFEWTPTEPMRQAEIRVEVRAEGDPHPRPGHVYDVFASFLYEVRPR